LTAPDTRLEQSYTFEEENTPVAEHKNAPIPLAIHGRRYTKPETIQDLAEIKYKTCGVGITFKDLLAKKLAKRKSHAQNTLKHFKREKIIFTMEDRKPQQYYPVSMKSEIVAKGLSRNTPVEVTEANLNSRSTGVLFACSGQQPIQKMGSASAYKAGLDQVINQSLEGYVLPLLPNVPSYIHKLQFKVRVSPGLYAEITSDAETGGKTHQERIGKCLVTYRFYRNGTVMVWVESSNNPFRLQDDTDISRFFSFLGQVRDRLIMYVSDKHERFVPDVMAWNITQCDINKDVGISNWLQFTGLKIQLKHLDNFFRVYIKSMDKDTVCRIEQSSTPRKPVPELIYQLTNQNTSPNPELQAKVDCLEGVMSLLLQYPMHQMNKQPWNTNSNYVNN
jgi:hypothetical protein